MKEIWYDIEGYENYYMVSNLGNVKSLKKGNREEKILKPFLINDRYHVSLSKNNICKNVKVSRLVLENVRGLKCKKYKILYKDNNKANNADSNIFVISNKQERKKYYNNQYERLTEDEVISIYLLCKTNKVSKIAKLLNMSDTKISNIKNKKTYTIYTKDLV